MIDTIRLHPLRWLLCLVAALGILGVVLSTWLMLKYWSSVIPFDGTTWDYFVGTFFILVP